MEIDQNMAKVSQAQPLIATLTLETVMFRRDNDALLKAQSSSWQPTSDGPNMRDALAVPEAERSPQMWLPTSELPIWKGNNDTELNPRRICTRRAAPDIANTRDRQDKSANESCSNNDEAEYFTRGHHLNCTDRFQDLIFFCRCKGFSEVSCW